MNNVYCHSYDTYLITYNYFKINGRLATSLSLADNSQLFSRVVHILTVQSIIMEYKMATCKPEAALSPHTELIFDFHAWENVVTLLSDINYCLVLCVNLQIIIWVSIIVQRTSGLHNNCTPFNFLVVSLRKLILINLKQSRYIRNVQASFNTKGGAYCSLFRCWTNILNK